MKKNKVVILGASGFVGASVLENLINLNYDAIGIGLKEKPWRLETLKGDRYFSVKNKDIKEVLNDLKPDIILNFIAHGAYSFQTDIEQITQSNFLLVDKICKWSLENDAFYVHAGTSSEYGTNCAGPLETDRPIPNSDYAITKLAATHLIENYSKLGLSSVVLRLYSLYGPKEDSSRLMPAVMRGIVKKEWPSFADLEISRDFIYLQDFNDLVVKIIEKYNINSFQEFEIFNVGFGKEVRLLDLVQILQKYFGMPENRIDKFENRKWDTAKWFSNSEKVKKYYGWSPEYDVFKGLTLLRDWYMKHDNVKYLNPEYSELQYKS